MRCDRCAAAEEPDGNRTTAADDLISRLGDAPSTPAFLNALRCPIVVVHVRSETVVGVSASVEHLSGYGWDDLVGAPVWDLLVMPEEQPAVRAACGWCVRTRTPISVAGTMLTRGGESVPVVWSAALLVDEAGSGDHLVMSPLPESFPDERGTLLRLVSGAPGVASLGTDLEGRVVFCSPAAEELLGRPAGELLGIPVPLGLFDEDELAERASRLGTYPGAHVLLAEPGRLDRRGAQQIDLGELDRRRRGTRRGGPADRAAAVDWTVMTGDGRQIVVSLSVTSLTDERGRTVGYLATGTDVTEERRTHSLLVQALAREQEAVRELARLDRAKSDFVATASHELRTPITSIVGFADLLHEDHPKAFGEAERVMFDAIRRNAHRLADLVEDLLLLTGDSLSPVTSATPLVDLRDVLRAVQDGLPALTSGRRLDVELVPGPAPVLVRGHARQLGRVLHNLVSNAVKFTADGGRISCRLTVADGAARAEVSDTGAGIPLDEQSTLFEQFYRGPEVMAQAVPGAGIGLSVVAAVVRAHDGQVVVTSEPGVGSSFTVVLPLAAT